MKLLASVGLLSEPEVDELDLADSVVHDVLGLDVSMHYILFVTMDQGSQYFLDGLRSQVLVHGLVRGELLEQLAAWAELHHQVDELFVFVGLVVLDDVGVVEGLEDCDFLVERLDLLLAQFLFRYDLNGHLVTLVRLVLSLEHLTETARPEHLLVDIVLLLQLVHTSAGGTSGRRWGERGNGRLRGTAGGCF